MKLNCEVKLYLWHSIYVHCILGLHLFRNGKVLPDLANVEKKKKKPLFSEWLLLHAPELYLFYHLKNG